RVASGGELSRVMLAIRAAGAESEELPTLVFDEVDAGIGGEAAVQVGLRLKALGAKRQVLVVTHLAQIACFADHHLIVEKARDADGRHVVRVRELVAEEERACELARMMSGTITEKALARAHELIDEAGTGGLHLRVASRPRTAGRRRQAAGWRGIAARLQLDRFGPNRCDTRSSAQAASDCWSAVHLPLPVIRFA